MLGCLKLEVSRQRSRPIKLGFTKLNFVLKSAIGLNVREPGGRRQQVRNEARSMIWQQRSIVFSKPVANAWTCNPSKTQCFYGRMRLPTGKPLAPLPRMKGAELIERPGVHHFDGNYVTRSRPESSSA